jgi:hypothetical protein
MLVPTQSPRKDTIGVNLPLAPAVLPTVLLLPGQAQKLATAVRVHLPLPLTVTTLNARRSVSVKTIKVRQSAVPLLAMRHALSQAFSKLSASILSCRARFCPMWLDPVGVRHDFYHSSRPRNRFNWWRDSRHTRCLTSSSDRVDCASRWS